MPSKPAAAPTVSPSSDFEEDTLLPPPAPGMEVPSHEPGPDVAAEHSAIPEHIVENPTLQGFVTHPLAATSDPLIGHSGDAVTRVLAELPVDRTQRMPLFVPSRLRDDETPHPTVSSTETLRMEPVAPKLTMRFPSLLPQSLARPTQPVNDSTPSFREQGESTAEIARAALSAASTIEMPAVPPQALESLSPGDALLARSTRSLPKISLPPPSEDTLPQLPFALSSDTLTGRLSYAVSGLRSLLRRRTQLRRLRGELGERLSAYDRALVQLGELAYSEHIELLRHVPGSDASHSDELPAGRDEAMLQVQRAAERFWAKAQKEQRALARKEAVLASELRVLRHRRDELYQRLVLLAHEARSGESSGEERYTVGMELAGLDGDSHKVAARLGEVRAELRLRRRQNHHLRSRREQLLYALSLDYAESARRSPHLLVLGSLLAGFRPQPIGGPNKRARFEALYALLDGLRGGIAKVETRLALLTRERLSADQRALQSAVMWLLVVVGLVVGGLLGLAFYLRSA